jgi:hypothetical protein
MCQFKKPSQTIAIFIIFISRVKALLHFSVLLDRICAEREKAQKPAKAGKGKKNS